MGAKRCSIGWAKEPSAAARTGLGLLGKLPLGKLHIWEVAI